MAWRFLLLSILGLMVFNPATLCRFLMETVMSKLTKEQAYCKMIDVLFAGAVRATPDEINNEVIRIVDTMFVEITKCHNMVKPIAVLFDGFATLYEGAVPDEIKLLIGSVTWQEYLLGKAQGLVVDRAKNSYLKSI